MRYWIVCYLFFFSLGLLDAQSKKNPFDVDIKEENKESIVPDKVKKLDKSGNVFDIIDRKEVKSQKSISKSVEFDNPFEVSHIPLRKSQIKNLNRSESIKLVEKPKKDAYYLPMILVLISCVLLGIALARDRSSLGSIYRTLNNKNFSSTFQRENSGGINLNLLLLYSLFFINVALFIFQVIPIWFGSLTLNYSYLLLFFCVIYFGRHFLMNVFSWLFPVSEVVRPYNFTIQMANTALGILLIPMNLLLAYGPELLNTSIIYIGIALIIIMLIIRYSRGISLSNRVRSDSLFHFFLYFCTFEILPFILVYSVFGSIFN